MSTVMYLKLDTGQAKRLRDKGASVEFIGQDHKSHPDDLALVRLGSKLNFNQVSRGTSRTVPYPKPSIVDDKAELVFTLTQGGSIRVGGGRQRWYNVY